MNTKDYLHTIREQLTMEPATANKIITEIQTHLQDQYQHYLLTGMDATSANQRACEEFGKTHEVAKKFNKAYRHPLRSFWRIVGLTLSVYTLIRVLVIITFSNSNFGRKFALTVGPGFYDREFFIYGCIGFAIGGALMARFIYQYMTPLNPAHKVLRLSLLLSAITVSIYHVLFSIVKFFYGMMVDDGLMMSLRFWTGRSLYETPLLDTVPIVGVWYYLGINVLYIGATTLVLFLSLRLFFWLSIKKSITGERIIA